MKKSLLFLSLALATTIAIVSCKKTEEQPKAEDPGIQVEKKNTALINKFTGSNCYYCGDWGWPMFEEIITEYHGKTAVCIGSYSQNQFANLFVTTAATAMDRRLPVTVGYPTFAANFNDAWNGTQTLEGMKTNISNAVNAHINASVVANSGLTYKIDGDNIIFNTRTKFFEAATGEFNLSVYVVEDKVIGNQSGPNGGPNASHHKVLRAANSDWGVGIVNGDVTADATFDKEVTIAKSSSWNMDNVEFVTIIWKKNGDKWDFVNAHLHKN